MEGRPAGDWMHELATHYERVRSEHPNDELLIVFDIDGTILDMRHMVREVLLGYDRAHRTSLFDGLEVEDVRVHENRVDALLEDWGVPSERREAVLAWYMDRRWSPEAVLTSHQPFRGVLDVIRWFQLQPRTHVGLNSGRPDAMRHETLRSLNALGREYRVEFDTKLLAMNPRCWEVGVGDAKVEALRRYRRAGYRVVAVVDNEPANIEAMSLADAEGDADVLYLHADTLFESRPRITPRTVRGRDYDITRLVTEDRLPGHVVLAWRGLDDPQSLERFLDSPIRWGECSLRRGAGGRLVADTSEQDDTIWSNAAQGLDFDQLLDAVDDGGKSLKIEIADAPLLDDVLERLERRGISGSRLWFSAQMDALGAAGFRHLSWAFPESVVQCPLDSLGPLVRAAPAQARQVIGMLRSWGINRFSIPWRTPRLRELFTRLQGWHHEVDIEGVPHLEAFLQAVLMLPRSITAEFDLPRLHAYGRGVVAARQRVQAA